MFAILALINSLSVVGGFRSQTCELLQDPARVPVSLLLRMSQRKMPVSSVLLLDVILALQSGRLSAGSDAVGFVIDRPVSLISGRKGTFLLTSC